MKQQRPRRRSWWRTKKHAYAESNTDDYGCLVRCFNIGESFSSEPRNKSDSNCVDNCLDSDNRRADILSLESAKISII